MQFDGFTPHYTAFGSGRGVLCAAAGAAMQTWWWRRQLRRARFSVWGPQHRRAHGAFAAAALSLRRAAVPQSSLAKVRSAGAAARNSLVRPHTLAFAGLEPTSSCRTLYVCLCAHFHLQAAQFAATFRDCVTVCTRNCLARRRREQELRLATIRRASFKLIKLAHKTQKLQTQLLAKHKLTSTLKTARKKERKN